MSNQQVTNERESMELTEIMENGETISQDKTDDEHHMPEQEKMKSIQFLKGRSRRSIDEWLGISQAVTGKTKNRGKRQLWET